MNQRLAVALRFVDWFASRGENYEHNMKIIDKHLKGLIMPDTNSTGSASNIHSYHLPGNKVSFHS
jgi:hypothetical protein